MSFTALEPITRVTPLGIRFRDEATGLAVGDGLTVVAAGIAAVLNPSDVFVFHGLPGLGAAQRGAGDAAYWSHPPATASFTVAVKDALGRFQPFSFTAPAPSHGLLSLPCAATSPPTSPPDPVGAPAVPLCSAPARPVVPGMAVVRAEIRSAATGAPAAFAVLEVDSGAGDARARGFADEQGRVLVILPYPRPPSGLGTSSRSIVDAQWPLDVRVRYAPAAASAPYPDLCAVLGQPPAVALARQGADTPLSISQLAYGQDLVLATAGTNVLLVT